MRTYGSDVRRRRTLAHVIEDTISIFQQDASEYAFAALIGAFAACMATLILIMIGGPVAAIVLPFALIAIAVATLATTTEALRRVTDSLEPSAAESFTAVLRGLPAILWPWLPLAGGLAAALLLDAEFGGELPSMLRGVLEIAVFAAVAYTALSRVLAVPSLVMRRATQAQATAEAHALFSRIGTKCAAAWGLCMAPALLVFLVPGLTGFGAVSSAIAALVFVGSLPVAAIANALLFFDAIADGEAQPARREPPSVAMARRTTGLRRTR
jgi:hypothetical protein